MNEEQIDIIENPARRFQKNQLNYHEIQNNSGIADAMRVISPTIDIAERLNSIYSQSETSDYSKVEQRKQSLAAQIQQYEKLPFTKGALSNRYSALNAQGKNQYATIEIESSIKAAENRFYMPQKRNSKPRNRPLNTALNIIESDLYPK